MASVFRRWIAIETRLQEIKFVAFGEGFTSESVRQSSGFWEKSYQSRHLFSYLEEVGNEGDSNLWKRYELS